MKFSLILDKNNFCHFTSIEKFRRRLIQENLSDNTIKTYVESVELFFRHYKEINAENVNSYQKFLETEFSPRTTNLRIVSFNRFMKFLGKRDYNLRIVKFRQSYFLENNISFEDYRRLKRSLSSGTDRKWYFIVWTMAATGVRISELVQISVQDIDRGYADVIAKGRKVRRVFFPDALQREISHWIASQQIESGPIFRNKYGRPISVRGISKGLEHIAEKMGIDKRSVHPHAFRHLFAKKFLEENGDLVTLAEILGHDSLETTKIYLRKTSQEQRLLINKIIKW